MGTRGLQGLGGRPQGRGCLLLAVAGATSLVTLLLAVPITVLAVLALVPQDQGRRVSGCNGLQRAASCDCLFTYGCASAHRAQLAALPRGNVWSVFASPGNPSLNFQAPSWLASFPDNTALASLCLHTSALFVLLARCSLGRTQQAQALGLGSTVGGVELPLAKSDLWAL